MRRRALTEQDRLAWASYAQNVVPCFGVRAVREVAASAATVVTAQLQPPPSPPSNKPAGPLLEIGRSPGGIDRSTWTKFRNGRLLPARKLDLHGHTLIRAYAELNAFITSALTEHLRCVEVVTGRGSGQTGGAIRREFPLWLNSPALRPFILAAAHPHAANPGSVRLLLRRVR